MPKNIPISSAAEFAGFREIDALPQWSATLRTDLPFDTFLGRLLETAEQTQHRYTGTITRDAASGNVTSFTHTRFRRNKYGEPPTIKTCALAMQTLAARFGVVHEREMLASGITRVTLGLYEGQHATGSRSAIEPTGPDYSVEAISEALGGRYQVQPAEVCTLRFDAAGQPSHYGEEIASVTFPTSLKAPVYAAAHAMRQERFSVEDFASTYGSSYMVETEWCRDPDPSTPVR